MKYKTLAIALLTAVLSHAAAATDTVNWIRPTRYTTGEVLPASAISHYVLHVSDGRKATIPGTRTSYKFLRDPKRGESFFMVVHLRNGTYSGPSNVHTYR